MANPHRVLYLASNNAHKLEELRAMIGGDWEVRAAKDAHPNLTWDESGVTFLENARIKAAALKKYTNHCILADDSGLEVAALNGAPGVWSSSYGGKEGDSTLNNARLLAEMRHIPPAQRGAKFVCTLLFLDEQGKESTFTGECLGRILQEARGDCGFGYDPLFEVADVLGKSMAEYSEEEKNRISHRSKAMAKWKIFIEQS